MNNEITSWEKAANSKWGSYITEIEKRAILKATLLAKRPATALEIGCEGGRWSKLLFDLGWTMVCTDINQQTLKICQNRLPTAKCILVSSNDTKIPCDTEAVELLLCIEVPQVIQSEWFINEAFRVIPSGGLVVGIFWNRWSLRGLLAHLTVSSRGAVDYYKLPYLAWKNKFRKRGFNILHEEGFCWFPFGRTSNSFLVPIFTQVERCLGLRSLATLSPWVVFIAQKKG